MSWTIDATGWIKQLSSPIHDGNSPSKLRQAIQTAISMIFPTNLSTAGRVGFFVDYSELSDAGTHTFYVARTHGTTGAISVNFSTGGDAHESEVGIITWEDGDASVKSFTVEVTSAQLNTHQVTDGMGEHRIWAVLKNPTGGAELHLGGQHTRAYGVIDNGVVASDANAVFYDSEASAGGNGSSATPYNSAVTALQNIGDKRYLYGKGVTVIDNSYTADVAGSVGPCLPVPSNRLSEDDRVYVRNWGLDSWSIQTDTVQGGGFFAQDGQSYCTYKGIDFINIDSVGVFNGFGIYYRYGDSSGINIEQCTADNINGSANTGAYQLWGVDGAKLWRCKANNVQSNGDNSNENTSMFFTYDGKNCSVQRCEGSNINSLIYHKRVDAPFDVTTSVRFCIDKTGLGVHYGASGSSGVPHSYSIVECNIFDGGDGIGIYHNAGIAGMNGSNNATKHWWCNNVFYQRGSGESAAIYFSQAYDAAIFNNIMLNCRKVWAEYTDTTEYGASVEYADYNLEFGTTLASQTYEWKAVNYGSSALLNTASSNFAANDNQSDPLFIDPLNSDFTLQAESTALGGGVGDTTQGAYIGNFYTIGANL